MEASKEEKKILILSIAISKRNMSRRSGIRHGTNKAEEIRIIRKGI
jgi:hypothetical protein